MALSGSRVIDGIEFPEIRDTTLTTSQRSVLHHEALGRSFCILVTPYPFSGITIHLRLQRRVGEEKNCRRNMRRNAEASQHITLPHPFGFGFRFANTTHSRLAGIRDRIALALGPSTGFPSRRP